jgi:acetyl esterase/lipase
MKRIARLVLPLLAAATAVLHVEAQTPRDFTSRVTWENIRNFAHTNADAVKKPVRGIIVFHHGLGCVDFKPDLKDWEEDYARHGLVAIHPHASPWGWMNGVSIKLADALLDCVIAQLKLPADIPVCSAGGSMGGQGALVFARYSRHHVVSAVANCPVCDLVFHETERPDLPRTIAAAFGDQSDYDAAIRAHSPLALAAEMPDIDYFIFHSTADRAVNKAAHSDRLVDALRAAGRRVTYEISEGTGHCRLRPEVRAKYELAILNSFPPAKRQTCDVPDVRVAADGTRIATKAEWEQKRRPELLKLFQEREYGIRPVERPADLAFAPLGDDREMMDGKALRKRVTISCTGPEGPFSFPATAFIPKSDKPVGAFILICNRKPEENIDPERVVKSGFWPAEEIVARGYAAVTFWNGDVARDDKVGCMTTGVFRAWCKAGARTPQSWGALSAWAWGASRVLDWLETLPQIDTRRVAVVGHSRGGKTALLAGVTDTRFALACVNDSGCSGAKLNRANLPKSESIRVISTVFPHWFCLDYAGCADKDAELDFDQHEMIALMAPRAVAIASASEDTWAGQRGEFCAAALASPVWELYGQKGLETRGRGFPRAGDAYQDGCISYHVRAGKHNLTPEDWTRYMDFADRVMGGKK